MPNIGFLLMVYIPSIIGIVIMNKLDPGNKVYPFYVLLICLLVTIYICF